MNSLRLPVPSNLTARSRRFLFAEWWRSVDQLTLILLLCLLCAGLVLSMAASPAASARYGIENPFYFLMRHFMFVVVGFGGAVFVSLFEPRGARRIGVLALPLGMKSKALCAGCELGLLVCSPQNLLSPPSLFLPPGCFPVRGAIRAYRRWRLFWSFIFF
jgi:hypothetical protein